MNLRQMGSLDVSAAINVMHSAKTVPKDRRQAIFPTTYCDDVILF
jgi:hypothetical protein